MAQEELKSNKGKPSAEPPAPRKSKKRLILIMMALMVVLLGSAGFLGWKYFKSHKANAATGEPSGAKGDSHGSEKEAKTAKGPTDEGATITFEPFLVNLADKDAARYLKTSIRILVSNKETATKISTGDVLVPRMRDTILSILSTKVADDVISNEGKQQLKKEIIESVNRFLPEKSATDVFFTDFVVQL
jgi:flagellar protein FliL